MSRASFSEYSGSCKECFPGCKSDIRPTHNNQPDIIYSFENTVASWKTKVWSLKFYRQKATISFNEKEFTESQLFNI